MEIFHYEFMRNAVLAAVLASIACGVIGSYVIVKRLVFISVGISHSIFGGVGLGFFLGINPIVTAIPFSLLCALGIGWVSKKTKLSADTTIGIFWAFGMAVGVIFLNLSPGYAPDLFSYLFGNILTVPFSDILLMGALDILILLMVALLYQHFLAISFDEEYSEAAGLPVDLLYYILLCLIALTVVVLIRVVGVILVIALLTMPAALAKQFSKRLVPMMVLATILGMALTIAGLCLSYLLDLASGATIILLSSFAFAASSLGRSLARNLRKSNV